VDLVVRTIPRSTLHAGTPFCIACTLGVAASVHESQQRTLTLAVQHVQSSTRPASGKTGQPVPSGTTSAAMTTAATNSRLASAVATAIASSIAPRASSSSTFLDGPLVGSPRVAQLGEQHEEEDPAELALRRIPPPESMPGDEVRYEKLRGATRFLGASTLLVPTITLAPTAATPDKSSSPGGDKDGDDATIGGAALKKEEQFWEFELEYTPLMTGFVPVGGLRVLLLEDQVHGTDEVDPGRRFAAPVILKEWDVIGEIWVKS
jgi:trafficking protein particle complex subunit 13